MRRPPASIVAIVLLAVGACTACSHWSGPATPRKGEDGMLSIGQPAPDFTLPDQGGNTVSLADFRGRKNVVLVFYPGDATPVCTRQLCRLRDDYAAFEARDTIVLGINPRDKASHQAFAIKHRFPFPLLVDSASRVTRAYACKGWWLNKRTVYGIDKRGVIVFARRGRPASEAILESFLP